MSLTRRQWMLAAAGPLIAVADERREAGPEYERPVFNLATASRTPVRVESIEVLRLGGKYLVRSRSTDGVVGLAEAKSPVNDFLPVLTRRVIPHFKGKDLRELESLLVSVYIANYKLAGQGFWLPVAAVETSLLDLLGKSVNKPLAELFGGMKRKQIPIYLSGSERDTTAEQEVERFANALERSGARAMKFKIGGRMSRNADVYPGRTEKMLELGRKRFGDKVVIYADANGSYDSRRAIEIGRRLEAIRAGFYEEPCPWEEVDETKRVADALSIPIAFGEVNTSLPQFDWLIRNKVIDIVQPDLNYMGGFVRTAQVARMAQRAGMPIINHNTETGSAAAKILHFAAAAVNTGPYIEYAIARGAEPFPRQNWYAPQMVVRDGAIAVPTGPGLGIEYDPEYLQKAVAL